jgi:ribose 5-phosphate isomerase B
MKIALAADHGGVEMKDQIKGVLNSLGHEYQDFGTESSESVDYPDFGRAAAEAVARGEADRGILVCGTGIGMEITANKVPGIRAAMVNTTQLAVLTREHNNINALTLGGRIIEFDLAAEIVKIFLTTEFGGDRHVKRLDKITKIEEDYCK